MSDLFLQTPNGQSELALQGDKPKMNKVNSVDQEAATKVQVGSTLVSMNLACSILRLIHFTSTMKYLRQVVSNSHWQFDQKNKKNWYPTSCDEYGPVYTLAKMKRALKITPKSIKCDD